MVKLPTDYYVSAWKKDFGVPPVKETAITSDKKCIFAFLKHELSTMDLKRKLFIRFEEKVGQQLNSKGSDTLALFRNMT